MKKLIISLLLVVGFIGCGKAQDGKDGVNGTNGIDGNNGTNGIDGKDGVDGKDGPAGEDGTEITVVKFCPNIPAIYPFSFPEIGFKINNKIYAVFSGSAGSGLVELIPGTYTTTTTNLGCTFKVKIGGVIENI
jgi:hypothetical protein